MRAVCAADCAGRKRDRGLPGDLQFKTKSAEAHASRLVRNGKVAARIAVLQQAVATKAVMTLREKRQFLARVVRTPIGEFQENDPIFQQIRRTTRRRTTIQIRMPDKLRAIELDAKLAGEMRVQMEVGADDALTGLIARIRAGDERD